MIVRKHLFLFCFLSCFFAHGQAYPHKPIRLVTSEPGGGSDFAARLIAQGLTTVIGQRVVVDNRGFVAGDIVARAAPDGYTLILYGSPLWLAPFLRKNVPFDPVKDFAPVSLVVNTPNVLVVHPAAGVKSVAELIALAKARPGELNYSSASTGSTQHLGAELFKSMAGVNIVRVPYKGSGPALTAVIAGQVQLMIPSAGSASAHVRSGRLRALAVTSAQPSALAPGLPTLAAAGLPGYESTSPFGIFAPAATAAGIVQLLSHALAKVAVMPDIKDKFFNSGVETVGSTPEQLAATIKVEMAKWGKLIRKVGIREE
jgi:tripartite-type tricarboxylate transporter receptor subunit TctC